MLTITEEDEEVITIEVKRMTRINLVDPSVLIGKHLLAEYRELPRIFTAVRKLVELVPEVRPHNIQGIPPQYVLGKGHMKFFYDKLLWLYERYQALYEELISRGYNLDDTLYMDICKGYHELPPCFKNDYCPAPEEVYLNMARIARRSGLATVMFEISLD